MNIFVLDECPDTSAEYMCDQHIPKMLVESAQMMASALLENGVSTSKMPLTKKGTPYRGGYKHHPCTKWVGETRNNYLWLADHASRLWREHYLRFGTSHACGYAVAKMYNLYSETSIPKGRRTRFVQAMPDEYKNPCTITAYRNFYRGEKAKFATWDRSRQPWWWK